MDISELSLEDLKKLLLEQKAQAYDARLLLEQSMANINLLEAEIKKRNSP